MYISVLPVHVWCLPCWGQKRALNAPELEVGRVVSHLVVLAAKPVSSCS